ncbi:hypothetical protein [Marmoricola sp. URHB0036]|uniref:hypothetical protein n=1 Tax=Marmoricola sp. URHB0036 TaxID=1298863 RepID=UPI0012DC0C6E|nr:hypothetical protein [Marmoricola sp. URHB0036]
MTTNAQAAPTDAIEAAASGLRAAAATAQELDYRGLAAALEDLALVLGALPPADACRLADALQSSGTANVKR